MMPKSFSFILSFILLLLSGLSWNYDKWLSAIFIATVILLNVPTEED